MCVQGIKVHVGWTYVFGETVVVAAQAEDEVAGLADVDAVADVLEQEGEAFPSRQRRHVTLRQGQVSETGGEGQRGR